MSCNGEVSDAADRPLLQVEDLAVQFPGKRAPVRAVDHIEFALAGGESLGIAGESGSGKSMTALAILGLVPNPGSVVSGKILYEGRNLGELGPRELREYRGKKISMIFQEPMTALNPLFKVGEQIAEAVRVHESVTRKAAASRAVEMLRRVQLREPERTYYMYPHELSGGMRQRVVIAIALVCEPRLVIADEPTTALDVTIQAEILGLLRGLQEEMGLASIIISHNLAVISQMSHRVAIMYAGRIVEMGSKAQVFSDPQHPYTVGLMNSIPRMAERNYRLPAIKGNVPRLDAIPKGCAFAPRCPFSVDKCRSEQPPLQIVKPMHGSACWRAPLERLDE